MSGHWHRTHTAHSCNDSNERESKLLNDVDDDAEKEGQQLQQQQQVNDHSHINSS